MLTAAASQAGASIVGTDWEKISGLITTTGPFVLQQQIAAPASGGLFGEAVAMWHDDTSGVDWAVVGAPNEEMQAGAAYIFSFAPGSTEWKQEARLVASDSSDGSAFGYSVAIDRSTVVIGSPLHEADFFDGAAYVFVRDEVTGDWTQEGDEINSADGGFGFAVAVNADALAISGTEEVFTYTRSSDAWSFLETLASPTAKPNSNFGTSLAMNGDELLVSAPLDGDVVPSQGSVILYSKGRDGWDSEQVLRPEKSSAELLFGSSIALSNDSIAVSAPAFTTGAVHIFSYDEITSTWILQTSISDTSTAPFSAFGYSIALSSNSLVVGNPGTGVGYVYRNDGGVWKLDSTLTSDATSIFGYSIAGAGDKIIIGAPESGTSDGEADVFISDRIFADGLE